MFLHKNQYKKIRTLQISTYKKTIEYKKEVWKI